MVTIPNLHAMDSTTIHQFAEELRGKLILAEERYSLAGPDEVTEAETEYNALTEIAMAISVVIRYMNAEQGKSMGKIIEKKKEVVQGKTIRQLWKDTPRPFAIKDGEYKKLVDFFSNSQNWQVIFYPENPNYNADIFGRFNLWDLTVAEAKVKLENVIEQNKKKIQEDRA